MYQKLTMEVPPAVTLKVVGDAIARGPGVGVQVRLNGSFIAGVSSTEIEPVLTTGVSVIVPLVVWPCAILTASAKPHTRFPLEKTWAISAYHPA
jgi:hypothetical protein